MAKKWVLMDVGTGVALDADYAVWKKLPPGAMFVCGGVDVQRSNTPWRQTWLRNTAAKGGQIGAVCTGSLLLADARLLDGYRWCLSSRGARMAVELIP